MLRAAAYCRVSTGNDEQLYSFESQKSFFTEYIGRQPDMELTEIYADEGITGTSTRRRSAFNRMIADAQMGKFDVILTKEVSRFARNTVDALRFTRQLKALGIGVRFMGDGIDTLDPDAELRLSIMGSLAQEESRKTSARVKWGQLRRMEQGIVFGRSLLGYNVERGRLSIEPEGAETVKMIFHKYVNEHKGTSVIAQELMSAGRTTGSGNTDWSAAAVRRILKNEKYCGDLLQKKTFTPDYLTHQKKYNHGEEEKVFIADHHEGIVSRHIWQEAQQEMKRRCRKGKEQSCHGNRYLMSGKVKCGCCGRSFVATVKKRSGGMPYRVWRCGNASVCRIGFQMRDELCREIVMHSVSMAGIDVEEITEDVTRLVSLVTRGENTGITLLTKKLDLIKEKKRRVLDAFFSGNISAEDMMVMKLEYEKKAENISRQIDAAKRQQRTDRTEEELKKCIRDIAACRCENEAFYRCILDHITAHPGKQLEVKLRCLPVSWWYGMG